MSAARSAFPKAVRLRRPGEFQTVLKQGRRVQEKLLTMVVLEGAAPGPRLGLAISARAVPLAVSRNRIKRLARETFRARRATLPAADIVLQARSAAAAAPAPELRATLERMWRRLGGS